VVGGGNVLHHVKRNIRGDMSRGGECPDPRQADDWCACCVDWQFGILSNVRCVPLIGYLLADFQIATD